MIITYTFKRSSDDVYFYDADIEEWLIPVFPDCCRSDSLSVMEA